MGSQFASETTRGLIAAVIAFGLWGVYPIFYHQLADIAPAQILAWRVVWSFALIAVMFGSFSRLRIPWDRLRSVRQWGLILLAAILVSTNWFVFIYTVSIGEILQASLGYFLNPTISALIGILIFKERLGWLKQSSVAVAIIGMTATFVIAGVLPVYSLVMATSFALYTAIRKRSALDSASGLYLETMTLMPVAVAFLWLTPLQPRTFEPLNAFWLIASGALTLLPLLAVVYASRRIDLSTLGLFQYIAPTMHLFIAVGLYGETLDQSRLLAFTTTLLAVALFTAGIFQELGKDRARLRLASG